MKQSVALLAASCLMSCAGFAHAQEEKISPVVPAAPDDEAALESTRVAELDFLEKVTPNGVSLGIGMLVSKGILLGEDARTFVVPTVGYVGERVFITGISGGVHLLKRDGFAINALLSARLDGWNADDLSIERLAAAGIDRNLLVNRKNELDAGFRASWKGDWGKLNLDTTADASGASNGYSIAMTYRAAFAFRGGAIVPNVGISYWSDDLGNYYYGTLPQEVAAGVTSYQPGSAIVPNLGVTFLRSMPRDWLFFGGVDYRWLNDDILDSPIVDPDARNGLPSVFFGFSRSFGKIH
ncbi:MAG TPA: MipA/OmpV family protein [Dokdonella sp.]|uniref:MipA/OmpV family protein n=1 Tax=Dokdonella sp. TaxID=2291710 RepID=UPI002D7F1A05|nr:MipA/OmpV family protein [Dokdonella sp.]HET9031268.1 MipA/OmpV family protein [Dokdonella sp.]